MYAYRYNEGFKSQTTWIATEVYQDIFVFDISYRQVINQYDNISLLFYKKSNILKWLRINPFHHKYLLWCHPRISIPIVLGVELCTEWWSTGFKTVPSNVFPSKQSLTFNYHFQTPGQVSIRPRSNEVEQCLWVGFVWINHTTNVPFSMYIFASTRYGYSLSTHMNLSYMYSIPTTCKILTL